MKKIKPPTILIIITFCIIMCTVLLIGSAYQYTLTFDTSFAKLSVFCLLLILLLMVITQLYSYVKVRKQQELLRIQTERYKSVIDLTSGVLWEYDIALDTLTKSDPDLGIHTGTSEIPDYYHTMISSDVIHPNDMSIFDSFYNALVTGSNNISFQFRARDISEEYRWFELLGTTITDHNNKPVLVVGQTVDIHDKKREYEILRSNIEQDSLTKLSNKKTAIRKITQILDSNNASLLHGLLLLDIDHLNSINNSYGYVYGDALLVELGSQLAKNYTSSNNVISRIGDDEFLVFIYDIPSVSYIEEQAQAILKTLNNTSTVTACIGISVYPSDGRDYSGLYKHADTALYHAKQRGLNQFCVYYQPTMQEAAYINQLSPDMLSPKTYQLADRTVIDASIITNTVQILFDARNFESSLNMILSMICNFYNLSYLSIIEYSEDRNSSTITYDWSSTVSIPSQKNRKLSSSDLYHFEQNDSEHSGVYYTNSPEELSQYSSNITGIMQCSIYENGLLQGFLFYAFTQANRKWEQHEIHSLVLISKIIGGYLLKIRTQERADRLECTDPLTNSYNMLTFTEVAQSLIHTHPKTQYIVLYADIDKFKLINETYGYSEGDRILITFASVLRSMVKDDETFGRINADKFIGLFRYNDPNIFLERVKYLNQCMNRIAKTDTDYYRLSIIIGLYPIKNHHNMSVNLDRANIARKSITNRHKSRYAFFNENMKSKLVKQKEIEDIMEDSIRNKEFLVYYQPKFYLNTNEICGAEALVRWNHPTKGLISPGDFIPIFEENHFIIKLDYYVFEMVCQHIRKQLDANKDVHPVSVNLSRIHFNNNAILSKLQSLIHKYKIPSQLIEIELTESALSEDDSFMYTILIKLHEMGFKLSMDDFGSGLSSLNLLRKLPFDIIKLDKEFFQKGTSTERERIVITNIVRMSQELHMVTISEGVETEEQATFLRSINCNIAQGYLFAKPMPALEYEQLYYM